MGLTDKSKIKISEAFELVENSLNDLRREVSIVGIDGFKRGEIENVYEMAKLYSKVIEVQSKIDKIRPTINSYILDLIVDKVTTNKEDKDSNKVNNNVIVKDGKTIKLIDEVMVENDIGIRRSKGELPVYITISDGEKIKASARILSNKKVIISVGSIISDVEDKTISKTNSDRRKRMILNKKLIPLENGGLKFTEDVQVDSLRMATNIIYGSLMNKVDTMWKTINGVTLREYLAK